MTDQVADAAGPALLERVAGEAPSVRLRFVSKPDKESASLRDGTVDLETGVVAADTGPELVAVALFRDRFVGVVRKGHPLTKGKITVSRYAAGRHVAVSRRDREIGRIDDCLAAQELARNIKTVVTGFAAAIGLAARTELIATVPERHTASLRAGLNTFELPFSVPPITVSLLWHPRMEADAGHRWLRGCVRDVCAAEADRLASRPTKR